MGPTRSVFYRWKQKLNQKFNVVDSGCGSVDREIGSNTKGPRFESSDRQSYKEHLFSVHCIEKTKIENEPVNGPFKKMLKNSAGCRVK